MSIYRAVDRQPSTIEVSILPKKGHEREKQVRTLAVLSFVAVACNDQEASEVTTTLIIMPEQSEGINATIENTITQDSAA